MGWERWETRDRGIWMRERDTGKMVMVTCMEDGRRNEQVAEDFIFHYIFIYVCSGKLIGIPRPEIQIYTTVGPK